MQDFRILVLTELFMPTKGGTAIWFHEVYRRLGSKSIHIVTAQVPGSEEVDRIHPNSVHRLRLQRVWWLRPESLGMYWRFFWMGLWAGISGRAATVHAGRALPEGWVAWLVARILRRKVAIYAHGEELTTWGRGYKYKTMRFALRHADRVIANSEFTRGLLIEMGVDPSRIVLIYPGVDVERFRPDLPCSDLRAGLGLAEGRKLILSVGRLQRRKGFDTVIRALGELVRSGLDVHYALIGIGEDEAYLRRMAEDHGVADRVRMLGHVSPEDLPRWYNAADVFAMPNREIDGDTEGFGLVFLEAAACGKPAIAGDAGGTGSAVLDGETGLRVDGKSLEAVTEALARVLRDPELAARLGTAALERAVAHYDWEMVAEKTRRLIRDMAA